MCLVLFLLFCLMFCLKFLLECSCNVVSVSANSKVSQPDLVILTTVIFNSSPVIVEVLSNIFILFVVTFNKNTLKSIFCNFHYQK